MRQFFRIALRVLILIAVFLASALTAMRLAIHGREVAMPKVVGMSMADANRAAAASGLFLYVEDRFYSADMPEGRILSQLPPAGESVRRGTRIRIALSLGPQKLVIPNLVGQSERAAEMNIARRGLEVGSVAVASLPGVPPDQVAAQSPPPNATNAASPKVNLLVSASPDPASDLYLTPDFVGHTLDEASRAVAESPMRFGKVTTVKNAGRGPNGGRANGNIAPVSPAAGPVGTVRPLKTAQAKSSPVIVRQNPAAGQKIPPGTQIDFQVVR
jgi:beta-lactam-binding protein with PASTA domain